MLKQIDIRPKFAQQKTVPNPHEFRAIRFAISIPSTAKVLPKCQSEPKTIIRTNLSKYSYSNVGN